MGDFDRLLGERVRGLVNPWLIRLSRQEHSARNALVISGHFRSGTTWLAELIAKSVDGGILFEPFHIDHVSEAKNAGFNYSNFRHPDESWPEGRDFVARVLEGKVLNSWVVGQIPIRRAASMKQLVIKLVAANQMLTWITANFAVPKPVMIIRHPCAVLASWLNRGWRLNNWLVKDNKLIEVFPEIADITKTLRSEEEFFAAKWCIDHYVPLLTRQHGQFEIVAYEKLVVEGAPYLDQILANWNLRVPDSVRAEFRLPSQKASENVRRDYKSVLSGWADSLSKRQQDAVMRVVTDFGLDFYSWDAEPDYERLFGESPVRSAS